MVDQDLQVAPHILNRAEVRDDHIKTRFRQPLHPKREVFGLATAPRAAVNEKQHGRALFLTEIPVQHFHGFSSVRDALTVLKTRLCLVACGRQARHHLLHVGRVVTLVVSPIQLLSCQCTPTLCHSSFTPEALRVELRLALSRAM